MKRAAISLSAAFILLTAAAALLPEKAMAGVNVYLNTPDIVISPSRRAVVVLPAPPPAVVIAPGPPAYWFWDDERGAWFYYDVDRRAHYARRHEYMDDGRHYRMERGQWVVGHEDNGKHKGWYKRDKHERHEDKRKHKHHDRDED